ncbi:MAG: hypothetical protein HJJLKODD_01024 [Phycisphaerae bacterium]|nr:hypothetical protein [Phycisphaerae bacterium]
MSGPTKSIGGMGCVLLVIVLLFTGAANHEPSADFWQQATQAADQDAVMRTVEQLYSTLSNRQWEALKALFAEGATIATVRSASNDQPEQAEARPAREWIDQYRPVFEGKTTFTEKSLHHEVQTFGTVAQVWSHFEATYTDTEHPEPQFFTGIDAFTLLKVNGQWRILTIAYASQP